MKLPNAGGEPHPEAGAQRRLEGVGCRRLILIEAPSPADHRGLLRAGDSHSAVRRRPQALLPEATPMILRHRPACPSQVPLRLAPGGREPAAPPQAGWPRTLAPSRRAVADRSGRLRRRALPLLWARRPRGACRPALALGPGPRPARAPGRSGPKRAARCPAKRRAAARRAAPPGLWLSRRHAGAARRAAAPQASHAPTGGAGDAGAADALAAHPARERPKDRRPGPPRGGR